MAKRSVSEAWGPVAGADGDEIDSIAEVILRSKADIFPRERHTQESNKKRGDMTRKGRRKMPGFPTKTVGTPTNRGKARRYSAREGGEKRKGLT